MYGVSLRADRLAHTASLPVREGRLEGINIGESFIELPEGRRCLSAAKTWGPCEDRSLIERILLQFLIGFFDETVRLGRSTASDWGLELLHSLNVVCGLRPVGQSEGPTPPRCLIPQASQSPTATSQALW